MDARLASQQQQQQQQHGVFRTRSGRSEWGHIDMTGHVERSRRQPETNGASGLNHVTWISRDMLISEREINATQR